MKKRLGIFLSILMMTSALAACSSGKTQETATSSTTPAATQAAQDSNKQEAVSLHIMHWNALPQNVIDKFEKENPNIKIQFEKYDVKQYWEVFKTRLAANELPDVFGASDDPTTGGEYIKQGLYTDLTDQDLVKTYTDNAIQEMKSHYPAANGKVYAISTNAYSSGVVWVNADLFKKAGVDVPANMKFEDLKSAAEKLKAAGVTPFVQGIKDGWPIQQDMWPITQVQFENPGMFEKLGTGETRWTDPKIVAGFQKWADLFGQKGMFLEGSSGLSYEQAYQTFEQGKAAMWPMGSWATEFMKDKDGKAKKLPFELKLIPVLNTDDKGTQMTNGSNIGALYTIYGKTKHPKEALQFLSFLTKPENATEYAKGNGTLIPIRGVDFASVVPYGDMVSKVVFGYPLKPQFNTFIGDAMSGDPLSSALQKIVLSGAKGEDVTKDLQKAQDKVIGDKK